MLLHELVQRAVTCIHILGTFFIFELGYCLFNVPFLSKQGYKLLRLVISDKTAETPEKCEILSIFISHLFVHENCLLFFLQSRLLSWNLISNFLPLIMGHWVLFPLEFSLQFCNFLVSFHKINVVTLSLLTSPFQFSLASSRIFGNGFLLWSFWNCQDIQVLSFVFGG